MATTNFREYLNKLAARIESKCEKGDKAESEINHHIEQHKQALDQEFIDNRDEELEKFQTAKKELQDKNNKNKSRSQTPVISINTINTTKLQ